MGVQMRKLFLSRAAEIVFALLLFAGSAFSQQSSAVRGQAYDVTREASISGTVVSYTVASATAPLGARMVLQTSSGQVTVHLGSSGFLEKNHFSLGVGDSVRVVGAPVSLDGQPLFLARVLQKGTQALNLRSLNGVVLGRQGTPSADQSSRQGGAR